MPSNLAYRRPLAFRYTVSKVVTQGCRRAWNSHASTAGCLPGPPSKLHRYLPRGTRLPPRQACVHESTYIRKVAGLTHDYGDISWPTCFLPPYWYRAGSCCRHLHASRFPTITLCLISSAPFPAAPLSPIVSSDLPRLILPTQRRLFIGMLTLPPR